MRTSPDTPAALGTAVRVRGLGKVYRIGGPAQRHDTLGEALAAWAGAPLRNLRDLRRLTTVGAADRGPDTHWALRDVSFAVRFGEVLGVIGKNGAGKTTLLKILSRITAPTTGEVELFGRFASMLEVGTGFHPDLTGRENVYLNGSLLGMRTGEIARKFDEIVAFSGVERFIDTPIKRYSSGMKVRLAFSVAAHLEPEILLIDEVLAVGDAEFQRRCLGKMHEVRQSRARAVIFVSHDMAAVEALCDSCLLLDQGAVAAAGPAGEIVERYLRQFAAETAIPLGERSDREGLGGIRLTGVSLSAPGGVATGRPLCVAIRYATRDGEERPAEFGCSIWSSRDVKLVSISSLLTGSLRDIPARGEAVCAIPALPLVHGHYKVNVFVSSRRGIEDYVLNAVPLEVKSADVFGTGRTVDPRWGAIVVDHAWSVRGEDAVA